MKKKDKKKPKVRVVVPFNTGTKEHKDKKTYTRKKKHKGAEE